MESSLLLAMPMGHPEADTGRSGRQTGKAYGHKQAGDLMVPTEMTAPASWLDQASSWSSIASALLALTVIIFGFLISSSIYQTYALLNRRRKYIGPVARKSGICDSRLRFLITGRQLLAQRVRNGQFEVRDELVWLSSFNPVHVTEEGLSGKNPVPIPFTFSLPERTYNSVLGELALGYTAYASSVRRRWLLRSAAGPLTVQEHECARATAALLSRWASFEPVSSFGIGSKLRGIKVELRCQGGMWNTRLIVWPDTRAPRLIPGFPVMGVSYQPYRIAMQGGPAEDKDVQGKYVRLIPQAPGIDTASPLAYDGVLSRLHGPGFRTEVDRITGRQKLHLCISETTYFAFRATQEPAGAQQAGDDARCSRLLTLNLLALDQDDVAVLVRRSNYVVYPGGYSGTVTGNCELAPREGLRADVDEYGLPDLLGAVVREAREELGLDLRHEDSQLTALGIIEYSGEPELETHALVATARLPGRAADFRIEKSAPSPAEGLWEIDDKFMAIDLAAILDDRTAGEHFINWLRRTDELTPAGAGSLLLLITARLELKERQASSQRDAHRIHRNAWNSCDLVEWLRAPLPRRTPRPGKHVRYHRLWKDR